MGYPRSQPIVSCHPEPELWCGARAGPKDIDGGCAKAGRGSSVLKNVFNRHQTTAFVAFGAFRQGWDAGPVLAALDPRSRHRSPPHIVFNTNRAWVGSHPRVRGGALGTQAGSTVGARFPTKGSRRFRAESVRRCGLAWGGTARAAGDPTQIRRLSPSRTIIN
jgi:hypothetical protein